MFGRLLNAKLLTRWSQGSEFLGWLRAAQELRWVLSEGGQAIYLPYRVRPRPRWGYGTPVHPQIALLMEPGRGHYADLVGEIEALAPRLGAIPVAEAPKGEPFWDNDFCRGLNAASLYAFPKLFGTRRYLEVGSGHSTKFVRRSIRDQGLATTMTSIDPHPRTEVDALCDEVIRQPLEDVAPSVVGGLERSDILMIDNSHRCLQNSDVTVVFLELLPRLRPGVLVYIDDIYLPLDYPPEWGDYYYSEQYLLAVLLMADAGRRYEILLPCSYMATDETLRARVDSLWERVGIGHQGYGNGIWLRVRDPEIPDSD